MPVANLLKGSRIHARAGLARVEKRHKTHKEHHVAGEGAEDEGARAVQRIARAAARTPPIVVASSATASGGPAIDRRLAPGAGSFALDLGRDGSKDRGHGEPCEDEFTSLLVGRTENRKRCLRVGKEGLLAPIAIIPLTTYVY
jgi:hypothetical protein